MVYLQSRLDHWGRLYGHADIKPSIDWLVIGWATDQGTRPERVKAAMALLTAADLLDQVDVAYLYDRKGHFEPDQLMVAAAARNSL